MINWLGCIRLFSWAVFSISSHLGIASSVCIAVGHLNGMWAVLQSLECMTALDSSHKCGVREWSDYSVPAGLPRRCCQVGKQLSVTLDSFYRVRGGRRGLFLQNLHGIALYQEALATSCTQWIETDPVAQNKPSSSLPSVLDLPQS